MDDYVKSIKEEVKTQKDIPKDKIKSNYRELFSRFMISYPPIKVESVVDGEVSFSVAIKDVGLSYQDIQKFRAELFSYITCNFVGELLVRENINEFANILTKLNKKTYADVVNGSEHKKFGFKIMRNRLFFFFHISLVQSILNEDFKRELRKKLEKS